VIAADRLKLGEVLVDKNLLLPEQLEEALTKQEGLSKPLGQVLVDVGLVSYDDLFTALSEQIGIPHIWLRKGLVDPKIVHLLPRDKAETYCVIPMFKVRNMLTLAMADCTAIFVIDDVENITGCKVQPVQCRREEIEIAIEEYYSQQVEMTDFLESFDETDVQVVEAQFEDLHLVEELAEGSRIINLVNMILLSAIREGASDVHIEPDIGVTRVRYRTDGVLREVMTPRVDLHAAIVSRIKVMGSMDIAKRRQPQDGRMHIRVDRREIDVRVSSMPMVDREKIVLRILDSNKARLDIDNIGFNPGDLRQIKRFLENPHGLILVTGPTGSGKTTTLYSALSYVSTLEKNIVTIEDPVEYQLPLINQIQVDEDHGLSFAGTLRSVLRQDPDIIMVGEIRDRDTAEVAIQAALTGHLVLSTLHTNESAGTIVRLIEMGVEPYLLTSSINAVVSQRLVRLVCPRCRTHHLPPGELLARCGWQGKNTVFVSGRGCEECFDTGFRNRKAVVELLSMTDPLRDLILRDPSIQSINDYRRRVGMPTLRDEATALVEAGDTSLEEALRAVFLETAAAEEPSEAEA
jgi:type IV pilus assembly protein PilB